MKNNKILNLTDLLEFDKEPGPAHVGEFDTAMTNVEATTGTTLQHKLLQPRLVPVEQAPGYEEEKAFQALVESSKSSGRSEIKRGTSIGSLRKAFSPPWMPTNCLKLFVYADRLCALLTAASTRLCVEGYGGVALMQRRYHGYSVLVAYIGAWTSRETPEMTETPAVDITPDRRTTTAVKAVAEGAEPAKCPNPEGIAGD